MWMAGATSSLPEHTRDREVQLAALAISSI
jgi:hypothetical protein